MRSLVCGLLMLTLLPGCRGTGGRQSAIWPPDTLTAERLHGNIYEVKVTPQARDPQMKVVLIWPPDTTRIMRVVTSTGPKERKNGVMTGVVTMNFADTVVPNKPWPPDTTLYPAKILMIWPPDTTH